MTLPERLKALLESRGCSLGEAAKLAGMEKQQVWRLLNVTTINPGYFTLQRLLSAIGCSMSELTEGGDLEMPRFNPNKGTPGPRRRSRVKNKENPAK